MNKYAEEFRSSKLAERYGKACKPHSLKAAGAAEMIAFAESYRKACKPHSLKAAGAAEKIAFGKSCN